MLMPSKLAEHDFMGEAHDGLSFAAAAQKLGETAITTSSDLFRSAGPHSVMPLM